MKAKNLIVVSLLVILGMSADLSAKVIQGFMDGDGSEKTQYQHRDELNRKIKYQFSGLNSGNHDFRLKSIKRKDGGLAFNAISIIQDKNKWLRDRLIILNQKIDAGEKPEWYRKVSEFIDFLDNIAGAEVEGVSVVDSKKVLETVTSRAVALYSMPKYVDADFSRILLAMNKPELYYDTFKYYFKMSIKDEEIYKKILKASSVIGKNGKKIFNIGGKIVDYTKAITELIDTIAYHETTSNGVNNKNAKDFIDSYVNSGNKLNLWGHYDAALTLNNVLSVSGVSSDDAIMMSTGTADSKVWNNGKNFSLKEDIKAASIYKSMDAKYSSFMAGDWTDWLLTIPTGKMVFNEKYYEDMWANDFSKAYMSSFSGNNIKKDSINNYVSNYLKLKSLDKPETRENVWLNKPTLSKTTVEQGGLVRMSMVQGYDSNEVPKNKKSQVCYRITTAKSWSNSYKVKSDVYSYSTFNSMQDNENEVVNLLVPESLNPGNYYFGMKADCNNKIAETKEDDNYRYIAIKVNKKSEVKKDDIYLTNSSIDDNTLEVGQDVYVRTRVNYRGDNSKNNHPKVYTSYYISRSRTFSKTNAKYLDYDSSSIGTDDSYDDEREKIEIPSGYSGTAYIHIVADNKNGEELIKESNEKNNIATIRVTIKSSASNNDDFYLTNSRVSDSSVYRGQRIKVYTYANYSGNTRDKDMKSVYTSYYIFCGNNLEYLDYDTSSLGSDDRRHKEYERITIPKSCNKGTAFIVVWIDNKNGVSQFKETNEDNNLQYVKIQIR